MLMGLPSADFPKLRRGPIEALSTGLELRTGDIALRCNIATIERTDTGFRILDRRAGRSDLEAEDLLASVNGTSVAAGEITVDVAKATGHRVVARLRGQGLSADITDVDPGAGAEHEGVLVSKSRTDSEAGRKTAAAVNEFVEHAFEVLDQHTANDRRKAAGVPPANALLTRGAGFKPNVNNILNHVGLKTAVVTGEGTAIGLGRLFGFDVLSDERFTGLPDTDVEAKIAAAKAALADHDMVYVHFKGPDIAAHDQNPELKKWFLEKVDKNLATLDREDLVFCVTGDHSTDSGSGRHIGLPVPTLIAGPRVIADRETNFGESSSIHGGLGHVSATTLVYACLDNMGVLRNFQIGRDGPYV